MAKKAPRSWGYWTEGKLDILARYLDRFTTTTKYKADARIYLDAFAGEGLGTSRTTRTQFEGSARIGLKVSDPVASQIGWGKGLFTCFRGWSSAG